ncbi:MAG: hypothetical protein AB1806_17925 [Acidobacteriota bacterium]
MMDELRQLFHTLNNQLGIILTHAELLEAKSTDGNLRAKATTVLDAATEALETVRRIRARFDAAPGSEPEIGNRGPVLR